MRNEEENNNIKLNFKEVNKEVKKQNKRQMIIYENFHEEKIYFVKL